MKTKRIIAGGTGFIGRHLVKHWQDQFDLVVIGRNKNKIKKILPQVSPCTWDELEKNYRELFNNCDLIVNLAGANIGEKPWFQKRKQLILNSRINTTSTLAKLCANLSANSPALFNASAIGVYGFQENNPQGLPPALEESTTIDFNQHSDFLSEIGRAWEKSTQVAKDNHVRVVNLRFAIVLARGGGVLSKMALPFHFFIGGPIGSARQPVSWIHVDDLLHAIDFIFEHTDLHGPVNCVAPGCVTQREFAKALGRALKRPSFMPTPAFTLKLLLGQMADELLLRGQHVYPRKLLDLGFEFKYSDIDAALREIYGK